MSLETRANSHAPDTKKGKERLKTYPLTVVYAGESRRRRSFLLNCFPDATNFSFPGGDEPDIPDVVLISKGKLQFVRPQVPDMQTPRQTEKAVIIVAADTRTSVITPNKEGTTAVLESKGKPKTAADVMRTFKKMHEAHKMNPHIPPYYQVVSASSSETKTPRKYRKVTDLKTTTVELNPDIVEALGSHSGFQKYMEMYQRFYSNPPYSYEGRHTPLTINDISGGISLPVLTMMGAVVAIDATPADNPEFFQVFKKSMYNASVSFSPTVLKPILPNVEEFIDRWDWLNQVSKTVLDTTK